ncbi:MAG: ATPase [Epsilonproteobacteria bacterium]|nr:ATPase [Campylobacterota bacterium]
MIKKTESAYENFGAFCRRNDLADMEEAIELFAVFGGLNKPFERQKGVMEALKESILEHYALLYKKASDYTANNPALHSLLSGVALGDGRIHSAYKKARLGKNEGAPLVHKALDSGIVELISSETLKMSRVEGEESVSDKLYFASPFMRFWFAFVALIYKSIKSKEYKEFEERFNAHKQELFEHTFLRLGHQLLAKRFSNDPFVRLGEYWDQKEQLDILGTTASGRRVAGICRYSNSKVTKSELSKLQAKAKSLHIDADIYVIIAKRGFSSELKAMKSDSLLLLSAKNLKELIG